MEVMEVDETGTSIHIGGDSSDDGAALREGPATGTQLIPTYLPHLPRSHIPSRQVLRKPRRHWLRWLVNLRFRNVG